MRLTARVILQACIQVWKQAALRVIPALPGESCCQSEFGLRNLKFNLQLANVAGCKPGVEPALILGVQSENVWSLTSVGFGFPSVVPETMCTSGSVSLPSLWIPTNDWAKSGCGVRYLCCASFHHTRPLEKSC